MAGLATIIVWAPDSLMTVAERIAEALKPGVEARAEEFPTSETDLAGMSSRFGNGSEFHIVPIMGDSHQITLGIKALNLLVGINYGIWVDPLGGPQVTAKDPNRRITLVIASHRESGYPGCASDASTVLMGNPDNWTSDVPPPHVIRKIEEAARTGRGTTPNRGWGNK